MKPRIGLKERIETANSEGEINALLHEGDRYEYATDGTRRKWLRAARRRTKELADGNPTNHEIKGAIAALQASKHRRPLTIEDPPEDAN